MGTPRCTESAIPTKHEQSLVFAIGERLVTAGYPVGSKVCYQRAMAEIKHKRRQFTTFALSSSASPGSFTVLHFMLSILTDYAFPNISQL